MDVTAFASVMTVLVFTLLLAQSMVPNTHHGVAVDLPKVSHPKFMQGADRKDAMMILIVRDGNIFFGNDQIAIDQLPLKIQESLAGGSERRVYIKADRSAQYAGVLRVLNGVRSARVENIAFLVDDRKPSSSVR